MSEPCKRLLATQDEIQGSFAALRMTASGGDGGVGVGENGAIDEEDETPFDKLREECGVMAVYNHSDAARLTYWGLYALQHRGQESAGIASADGQQVNDIKGMGLVSEIFTDDVLARLPGQRQSGHNSQLRRKILDQNGHRIRPQQHPQQPVPKPASTFNIRRKITRIDIRHRRHKRGAEVCPHLVSAELWPQLIFLAN